ncbi:MAG: TIGR03663 family protein [Caldilineaceae bacterium]
MTTKGLVQDSSATVHSAELAEPTTTMATTQDSLLDRSLFAALNLNWELIAWGVLLITAAVLRLVDVGVRAMSHDESLHALYSYYLYDNGKYEHNPMMHGPLLFHMNAIAYFLFGDNDTTARLVPAIFGIAVIGMMWLFRRYIGRLGALTAAILITISPSLLFHSRYIRNDIYIALFMLIWIYGAFRYLETRNPRWLMVMALGMAWGFITKENHFMNGAIMGGFFVGLAFWQIIGNRIWQAVGVVSIGGGLWYWLHIRARDLATQANSAEDLLRQSDRSEMLGIIALGIAFLVALVLIYLALKPGDIAKLRRNAAADLAVLMVSLILPFVSPFILAFGFRWELKEKFDNINAWSTSDMAVTAGIVLFLTVISLVVAYVWFEMRPQPSAEQSPEKGKKTETAAETAAEAAGGQAVAQPRFGFFGWLQIMGTFWLIQVLFFTTFFTNFRNGLATGIVGSLGYWLAQQEVARGGQPWYYYLMLGALYEFLPWILSAAGMLAILYWIFRRSDWDPVAAADLPTKVQAELLVNGKIDEDAATQQRQVRLYFAVFGAWW